MNMKELFENTTPEQKTKAIHCKSAEELLQFAKSEGIDLSAEDAAELFSAINSKTGEISDDDLDNVAGGSKSGKPQCPSCGSFSIITFDEIGSDLIIYQCSICYKTWG